MGQALWVIRGHPSASPTGIPGVTEPHPTPSGQPAGALALLLSPHVPLLAVGPPLLTLVNFEVENLAYMLVCLQWMVSWALPWPPGHTAMWQKMGHQKAPVHTCKQACMPQCGI